MHIDRRTLLKRSCLAAAAGAALPRWMAAGIFRDKSVARAASSDTVLVVVQMGGGNDGLNTVVPVGDATYQAARPRLALTSSLTLPIDSRTALHPSLEHLHDYLDQGKLAIVQGVGYPTPDLSHFRSIDVWESGVTDRVEQTGWLGRALDSLYGTEAPKLHAVSWGFDEPLAVRAETVTTPVVLEPSSFRFETDSRYPQDDPAKRRALQTILAPVGTQAHDFIANAGTVALADSAAILGAIAGYSSSVTYPESELGNELRLTASVLFADIGPRIFWVQQDGYDTHDSQRGAQDALLADLDASLDAFYRDCVLHGVDRKVVVMTWSEFGRRVEDNASGGTDHGTAGPLFVLGSRVRGGLFGEPPSLTDLDPDGNLKHTTDFRQVYASILANWIGADPVAVLHDKYPTLSFL